MSRTLDDIFAGKGGKSQQAGPHDSNAQQNEAAAPELTKNQRKKLKQKSKKQEQSAEAAAGTGDAAGPVTEEKIKKKKTSNKKDKELPLSTEETTKKADSVVLVVDGSSKKRKDHQKAEEQGKEGLRAKRSKADDMLYGDTRGTLQQRQKTEDGYTVYKEDDLKLSTSGGGTFYSFLRRRFLKLTCIL